MSEKKTPWLNLFNTYVIPRTFIENCVLFAERTDKLVRLKLLNENLKDIEIIFESEEKAIEAMVELYETLNNQEIYSQCFTHDLEQTEE